MPLQYTHDESPRGSVALHSSHLRRRSSVSHSNSFASSPAHLGSPFISHLVYDDKTGEISLPASPPLHSWRDKHGEKGNTLGLVDEKRLPPYYRPPKGRAFQLHRPWFTAMALGSVTVTFFFLVSYLVPPSSPYNTQSLFSRIRTPTTCEPYSSFGSLNVDLTETDKNQWVPFDPTCQPPAFLAQLRDEHSTADFSWLHNKTALIIGDSISREHVENFCQLMGEESEVIRGHHKYATSPTAVRGASKAQHTLERPKRLSTRGFRVVRDASRPRMCYIPRLDFLLVSVFHFGLDQEDYWRESRMPQYQAPGMFEHRLADNIQPLVAAMRADGRHAAPDFVEVSSGTWDLARWAEQDVAAQRDTSSGLAQDRVTWYRFRVGQILEKVRKAFPDAKAKTWRSLHYPLDQAAEQDYFMDKISSRTNVTASNDPPSFSHNRIYQLDQAVRSLVLPTTVGDVTKPAPHADFRINEWGPILKGQEAHQRDRLHGDPLPGGYVWSDIMLYEMFRGVRRSEAQPMRRARPSRSA